MTLPNQTPAIAELASKLRDMAARATDATEDSLLRESADRFEMSDLAVRTAQADLNNSIANLKSLSDELKTSDNMPWWVVLTVLAGFFLFLYFMTIKVLM
jgi:hypothetical protein